jgi:Spy/CpxP family protein refolding chaperone
MQTKSNYSIPAFMAMAAIISAVLVFSGCHAPWSCHRNKSFEKRIEKVVSKISKELVLTQAQKDSLDKIKSEIIVKKKFQKDGITKIDNDIIALIKSNSIEKAKLKELIQKKKTAWEDARKEMHEFILDKFIEFHKVLTPDQRVKLTQYLEQHKHHHKHNMWKYCEIYSNK